MSEKQVPIANTFLMVVPGIDSGYVPASDYAVTDDLGAATVVTSLVKSVSKNRRHKVVLDIDLPAQLIPSSTPGHFHLYIDHEIEEWRYFALLDALASAGVIEDGYKGASRERGFTAARLPWVKKGPKAVSSSERRATEAERLTAGVTPF